MEFFIVAEQRRNLLRCTRFDTDGSLLQRGGRSGKRRKRRDPQAQIIAGAQPDTWFKGKPQVASIEFRPSTWKPYRYVIKRTSTEQQLPDDLRKYAYYIVEASAAEVHRRRGNQENLIKFKHGLGTCRRECWRPIRRTF